MSYLTSMEGHDPQSLQFFMVIKAALIILEIPIRFTSTMNLTSSNPSFSNFLRFQIFLSDWTLCLPWVWSKRFSHKTWNYIEIFWSKKLEHTSTLCVISPISQWTSKVEFFTRDKVDFRDALLYSLCFLLRY